MDERGSLCKVFQFLCKRFVKGLFNSFEML